tara:strand:+ start:8943 stop:9566 length:624 start_codon:yes stop_codon:yes gene_type:complete
MGGGSDPATQRGEQLNNQFNGYINTPAPAPSAGTTSGISSLLSGADPAGYSQGVGGAISSFADTASGKNIGVNAPGYQAVRNNLESNIMGDVNASMGAYGRQGSNVHTDQLTSSLASQLGGLDMAQYNAGQDRQVQAAQMLPGLQQAATQPGMTQLAAGGAQDSVNNADFDRFLQLLQANTSVSETPGMEQEAPWWQTLAGTALSLL